MIKIDDVDFKATLKNTLSKITDDMEKTCRLTNTGGIYDMDTARIDSPIWNKISVKDTRN